MNDLVERARQFATQAHRRIDQLRKYTFQPYEVHLKAVAEIVSSVTDDSAVIAAAWLHDTVEDTPATLDDLEREFGREVAALVDDLTDVSRPADGNRQVRKALDLEHVARASARAKTVKLADLIDNCGDICRHDAGFGRVFLSEMEALLDVLGEGDARLLDRARAEYGKWNARLGPKKVKKASEDSEKPAPGKPGPSRHGTYQTLRQFAVLFSAQQIAEPLRSFDHETDLSEAEATMSRDDLPVVGVRTGGRVSGFLPLEGARQGDGPCGAAQRELQRARVVDGSTALPEVIHVLTRHDQCFVRTLGDINGIITRADMQKPIARMWLFGVITFIEMAITERIRGRWPDGTWTEILTTGRLEKARELHQERTRRGQPCELLDCLQFSDRAYILMEDPTQPSAFGFPSKSAAKRVLKDVESLRNNLAHAQDVVTHDWAQIARIARRIEVVTESGSS